MSSLWPDFKINEFTCRCCGVGEFIISGKLLTALQSIRNDFKNPMIINCGYRCPKHNAEVGGAPQSAHLSGEAADISDTDQSLRDFLSVPSALEYYGIWAEDFAHTPTWVHLQVRPTKERIFIP